ncbi:potassium channel family protein [Oscillatoria sp. CS-180]|uniref:potassium channel family protein n=1 Tax=Oscillatoria sp. CS-180 TaxID=3021720 RepID=UPI00232CCCD8|nr:potassium channel family protein [Oscillatoria sp. CS-180]MDB9526689.1 potassium channel family protein [Oscillatoria sp. CS-180]
MLTQILGTVIIAITLVDVYLTVLYPRTGRSVISLGLSRNVWAVFRWVSRWPIKGSRRVLSYCGPSLLVVIVIVWVCAFTLGFALIIWPALGVGIQASQGETPTDFQTALYYSGYTLTTLGVGDLVPKNSFWRLITVLEAAVGFSIITASLTYLLSVYSALTQRNTFALSLHHKAARRADAAVMLTNLKGQGNFDPALQELSNMSRDLLSLLESHHAYPILHYFRFHESRYSLARMAFVCLDLTTLVQTALHPQVYEPLIKSSAVIGLESSSMDLLVQLADSFLGDRRPESIASPQEWRRRYFAAISLFEHHHIKTVKDVEAGADHYVATREKWDSLVLAFAQYMEYSWDKIISADDNDAD